MELLTSELQAELPKLYAQEDNKDPTVYAKFFFPARRWTWFVTEGESEGDDFRFFGYVVGNFDEWGYFSLNELQSINIRGLTVERDLYFEQGKFSEVIDKFRKERGK